MLGRVVTDQEGLNEETEERPGVPADAEGVLRCGMYSRYRNIMDMVWGSPKSLSLNKLKQQSQYVAFIYLRGTT